VAGVRAEKLPVRGIDGGRRRLPWWLGENGEGGVGFGNTRPREVYWGLVKLAEWSAGGERERGHELKAAAAMAGGGSGWRTKGRRGGLSRPAWVRG
jgi:hypothetical protein